MHKPKTAARLIVKLENAVGNGLQAKRDVPGSVADEHEDKVHEYLEKIGLLVEEEEKRLQAQAAYHLKTSFRHIDFHGLLELEPTLNKARNLRGMVTSRSGRIAFDVCKKWSRRLGAFGTVISVVDEAWQLRHQFETLVESDLSPAEKIDRTRDYAASIAARIAASTVLESAKFVVWSGHHLLSVDTRNADDTLAHATSYVREVSDPDNIHKLRVYIRSRLHLPPYWSALI